MPNGWKVVEGTLTKDSASGDIMTADRGDVELQLEWKIAAGGNAGLSIAPRGVRAHLLERPEDQLFGRRERARWREPPNGSRGGVRAVPSARWNR